MRAIANHPRLGAAALIIAAVACKARQQESEVSSLDNFARSESQALQQNVCHGGYDLIEDLFSPDLDMINFHEGGGQSLEVMQTRVESALRAVPTEIQVAFFGVGGIIEVTSETHNICAQGLDPEAMRRLSEGGDRIKGCWKYQTDQIEGEGGQREEDPRVVIYVDTDAGSIEHALVRNFGYVLSQVLVKLDRDGDKPRIRNVAGDPKFDEAKDRLTMAFLRDVAESQGKYTLDRYTRMVGTEVVSADELARRTGWDQLKRTKPDAARAFADYVFAESFDSFYCSEMTKDVMTRDFGKAMAEWQPVADAITGIGVELKEVGSPDEIGEELKQGDGDDEVVPKTEIGLTEKGGALGLRFFGGFFRGVGRVVGGVARGVFLGARAVVGAAARVAWGTVRLGAAIVRGTARVVGAVFRGAVRVARGVVVGAARVVGAAARFVVGVGRVVVRGGARVVRGVFGAPTAFASEAGMIIERSPSADQDGDGVEDALDLCRNTPQGASVHLMGDWSGCAQGQYRDKDR